mgnify:CR=1 FL=1
MRQAEVVVGAIYLVRVSGNFVAVRIVCERERANGQRGWIGVNLKTDRTVLFRGAARLRYRLCEEHWKLGKVLCKTWGSEVAWCRQHAPTPAEVAKV